MGIVAHWKMNDNADTNVVVDTTGNYNGVYHGTGGADDYTSAHTIARTVNTALDFDGTQDYVEAADHADFSFGDGTNDSPFSISTWVYMDDAVNFIIVSKWVGGKEEWRFFTSGSKVFFDIWKLGDARTWQGRKYNTALSAGQWYHIVVTYDGRGGADAEEGMKIYIDGVRKDDTDANGLDPYTAMNDGTQPVYIGRLDTNYSDGKIDNVIIFDNELSIDDVKILYSAGHGTEITADLDESRRIKRRPIWQR